jgi:predicted ester cyclase
LRGSNGNIRVAHGALGDFGFENYKQHVSELADALPGVHMTIDDKISGGDRVVVRYTFTGTHKATNKKMRGWAMQIDSIVGGKIVERWTREDTLGFAQQLGAIPTPKME